MLKIFVLARVTPKSFKALPGLEGCQLPPDSTLLGSNVYSIAESVLLAWLTVHLSKVKGSLCESCESGCTSLLQLPFCLRPTVSTRPAAQPAYIALLIASNSSEAAL